MPKYSVIVPVYNRPNEVEELLESLAKQDHNDFEIVLVEDGSTEPSDKIVDRYQNELNIRYFFKENTGPGDSRNFGMENAEGDYYIFFDSDCIIPSNYFTEVDKFLAKTPLDAWGGPDDAHPSFTKIQKAINHTMTSFFTTGGIRGKKNSVGKFQPRSFNMGLSKEVYAKVGGFGDIHPGEDPDLSFRIMNAGFSTGLIPDAVVYHKRRIDFSKFTKQVYKFGITRVILSKWHKGTFKPIYTLPSLFVLGTLTLLLGAIFIHPIVLFPIALFIGLVFLECLILTKDITVSLLSIVATFIQMFGYGVGFLESVWKITILKKNERKAFKKMFF